MKKALLSLIALCALFGASAQAADTDGAAATVSYIVTVTPSASTYAYYHGAVKIGTEYFYWGGSWCSGLTALSDAEIDRLYTARIEGITVNPWYQTPVSSSYKCLTIYQTY